MWLILRYTQLLAAHTTLLHATHVAQQRHLNKTVRRMCRRNGLLAENVMMLEAMTKTKTLEPSVIVHLLAMVRKMARDLLVCLKGVIRTSFA